MPNAKNFTKITNIKIIGDQGSRKYDENLANQANQKIEAEKKQKELDEKKKTDLEETLEKTITSIDYSKNSNLEIPPIIADKTLINNYDLAKIGKKI